MVTSEDMSNGLMSFKRNGLMWGFSTCVGTYMRHNLLPVMGRGTPHHHDGFKKKSPSSQGLKSSTLEQSSVNFFYKGPYSLQSLIS